MEVEMLEGEIFKTVTVKGIDFEYLISNKGRLISLKNNKKLLMSPTQEPGKCGRPGYLSTALRYPDKSKYYNVRVHILVGRAFVSNPDNLKELNHEDGNKTNNNDWNLKWSTRLYNIHHSFATGLNVAKKGAESHMFNKGRKVIHNNIVYDSIAHLARTVNVPRTSICSELDGRMKTKIGVTYAN